MTSPSSWLLRGGLEDDIEAVGACLRSGWLTMGPRTQAFEEQFADYLGCGHAVALSSGSAALHLALLAGGVRPGDEVLVSALGGEACAAAARRLGAAVVLAGPAAATAPNVEASQLAGSITARTKAVVTGHLMGYPSDAQAIRALCDERGVVFVEDVTQALGARLADGRRTGSAGHFACFSLASGKQLDVGEGGMVLSEDVRLCECLRLLRSHAMTSSSWDRHRGHAMSYDILRIGFNYRMDELHAALGSSRLRRLDRELAGRRELVGLLRQALTGSPQVELVWGEAAVARGSHLAFPMLAGSMTQRDRLRRLLGKAGFETVVHRLAREQVRPSIGGDGQAAEDFMGRHLVLPLHVIGTSERARELAHLLGAG